MEKSGRSSTRSGKTNSFSPSAIQRKCSSGPRKSEKNLIFPGISAFFMPVLFFQTGKYGFFVWVVSLFFDFAHIKYEFFLPWSFASPELGGSAEPCEAIGASVRTQVRIVVVFCSHVFLFLRFYSNLPLPSTWRLTPSPTSGDGLRFVYFRSM